MIDPLAAELRMTRFEVERLKQELAAARAVISAAKSYISCQHDKWDRTMDLAAAIKAYDKVRGK